MYTHHRHILPSLVSLNEDGEFATVTVKGDSMSPVITDGDKLVICRSGRIYPGDVIVFLSMDERLVVHRLLGYRRRSGRWEYVLRGDSAIKGDAPVTADKIIGKVEGIDVSLSHRLVAIKDFLGLALNHLVFVPLRTVFTSRQR